MSDLTIVTGLFDIGRETLSDGFKRDFSQYEKSFSKLLDIDVPMVIFTTKEIAEKVVWVKRKKENTHVVIKTNNDIKQFPFFNAIDEIRKSDDWKAQASWLAESPQAKLELYNPLVMSKQFWLNDATLYNPFNTEYFLWVDAGIANTIGSPDKHIHREFVKKVIPEMSKMLYICFPYGGTEEVHGFKKYKMDELSGTETEYVARGGIFGGSKYHINKINHLYYRLLLTTLTDGYMGTEESIFTILSYQNPHLCNINMIDRNGLVVKFLNNVNGKKNIGDTPRIAIYALTYNSPKQFSLWVESFKKAFPDDYLKVDKYVINNTNNHEYDTEYTALFKLHGFTVFSFDNIGICDGRQFAAEHFSTSDNEYMIFFEDDMLLYDTANNCKSGFPTHVPKLFDKLLNICESEKLDFLKLSFSEIFGDNHEDWASYNVDDKTGKEYYPSRDDGVSRRKTKIEYTGTYDGLSYAVGGYHYCNWPILFNKVGNRKVFLDKKFPNNYEQHWMSYVAQKQHNDEIKAGCLLASPINHSRMYFYGQNKRRENKHYTN